VHDCSELEYIPQLTCLKTLQNLSMHGCTKLSSIYNKLTDFEVLNSLVVSQSGIGEAIASNTDSSLAEQAAILRQRPGFCYIDYKGTCHGDSSELMYANVKKQNLKQFKISKQPPLAAEGSSDTIIGDHSKVILTNTISAYCINMILHQLMSSVFLCALCHVHYVEDIEQISQDDIVYLEPESMLDNDDNTEVLAKCDVPTQPGILKSEWYNIELHVPSTQTIDVRLLPAFDLLGQLTSDGSTMLFPSIVQCTGTAVGTLKVSFDVDANDTHVDSLQI
jgi:hypothetical protein